MKHIKVFVSSIILSAGISSYAQDTYLDTAFGNNGILQIEAFAPKALHLQQDGKILVAGGISTSGQPGDGYSDFVIYRFNMDGSPDQGFGTNGKVQLNYPLSNTLVDIVELPDGRLFGVGTNTTGTNTTSYLFARLNSNGAIDTTYGTDGFQQFATTSLQNDPTRMIKLQDGRIAVAGTRYTPNGQMGNTGVGVLLVLNNDQNPDLSFNATGYRTVFANLGFYALAADASGRIITGNNTSVTRYLTSGGLDPGFANAGQANVDFGIGIQWMRDVNLKSGGKMLLSARRYNDGSYYGSLVQLTASGTIDTDYGNNGFFYPGGSNGLNENVLQTLILDNGSAVSLLQQGTLNNYDYRLQFTTNSGTLNALFGNSGEIVTLSNGSLRINTIAVQPDGKILALGNDANNVFLTRYIPTATMGTPDFSNSIISVYPNPATDKITVTGLLEGTVIKLYSISGQKLAEVVSAGDTSIDISSLARGMYLLNTALGCAKIIKK